MHVYMVGRSSAMAPPEFQVNVQGLENAAAALPVLAEAARGHRSSRTVVSRELSVNGTECVHLFWRTAFLVAHSAYPAMQAVELLKRIESGDKLISVLHLAVTPAALLCESEAHECAELMRENLERTIRRQNGIAELLKRSGKLRAHWVRFRRRQRQSVTTCCECCCM